MTTSLERFLSRCDEQGVTWALLRGRATLGESGRDVDLLVDSGQVRALAALVRDHGGLVHARWAHPWHRRFYVEEIELDVVSELRYRRGAPIRTDLAAGCLERRVWEDGLFVLSPTDRFWTVLLHCLLDKGFVSPGRAVDLLEAVPHLEGPGAVESFVASQLPSTWSTDQVVEAVLGREWGALEALAAELAPQGGESAAGRLTGALRAGTARSVAHIGRKARWRRPKASERGTGPGKGARSSTSPQVRVSFSGLDGAGKTRQIEELVRRLGQEVTVEVVWVPFKIWPETLLNRLPAGLRSRLGPGRRAVGPDATEQAAAGLADRLASPSVRRSPVGSLVWTVVGCLAAVSAGLSLRRRVSGLASDVVVLDRYRMDTAVKLHYWYAEAPAWLLSGIVHLLAPRPSVEILLRVPPEVAFARKAEQWSLHQLSRQASAYDAVAMSTAPVVLDAQEHPERLSELVHERVRRMLASATGTGPDSGGASHV